MKRYIALWVTLLILSLAGCGAGGTDDILRAPPVLTVICDDQQVEALWGTSYWSYQQSDGMRVAANYDSSGPLYNKEQMTPLSLSNEQNLSAYLKWEVMPDTVSVYCWSEEIQVETGLAEGQSVDEADYYTIQLKDGNYIYEVVAEWNRSELYGGTVRYSFYTEK